MGRLDSAVPYPTLERTYPSQPMETPLKNFQLRPGWSLPAILLMVVGFLLWWPLGLAVLVWILWGDRIEAWWHENRHRMEVRGSTGNEAFEEHRRAELERLEQERRRLEEEAVEFQAYLNELRRARDQEEFERFKRERRPRPTGERPSGATA
jgi:hypothetical protein